MPQGAKESALRSLIAKLGLDAIVAMSPENFTYVSGVYVMTVATIRPRQAYAIIPARGEAELALCITEKTLAQEYGWIDTIHTYVEFAIDPIDVLVSRLKALGVGEGRVGIDADFLPLSSYQRLVEKLPNLTLVNTTEEIAAIRAIKSPAEIDVIERGAKGTHQAVLDGMAASHLGDSERQMCSQITRRILENGASGTFFVCFSSGDRTRMAHTLPTGRVPQETEVIRFDLGGIYGAFTSDFARTYSTGNPTALQRQTYSGMMKVQKAVIAAVRPGILAEDLFYLARDEFRRNGLAFGMAHIGHSFGVELHEYPMLRPGEKAKLVPGMVLNIEPVVGDETGTKYHTEDLVEVTEHGCRIMTLGLGPDEIPIVGRAVVPHTSA